MNRTCRVCSFCVPDETPGGPDSIFNPTRWFRCRLGFCLSDFWTGGCTFFTPAGCVRGVNEERLA